MAKELYFVESIYTPQDGNMSVVCLQSSDNKEQFIIQQFGQEQMRMHDHHGTIKEGWYVYYDIEKNGPFGYGNLSPYARERFRKYYDLRDTLTNRYISPDNEMALTPQCFSSTL